MVSASWVTTPLIKKNNRYIGDIKIHNEEFDETYYGFEITKGVPSFLMMKNHLAKWSTVMVITRKMVLRVSTIKMFMVATSMDPILSRNANLAYRLVTTALRNKYGQDIELPSYDDILSSEVAEEYADTKSKAEFEK